MRWQTYEPRLAVMSAYPVRDKGLAWFFDFCVVIVSMSKTMTGPQPNEHSRRA
jgi:hypothetical protein